MPKKIYPDKGIVTAFIYTRVSSDEQAREGISLDAQLRECRQYVARQPSWVLGREFQDILSGTRDDRPDYQGLLAEVRKRRAASDAVAVIVMRLDRFGRRVLERVRCREELKGLGVPTHSVREGGEVPDLVANVLASVAEEEVRQLGERVSAVKQHCIKAGFHPGGRLAWGYRCREATPEERAQGAPRKVLEEDPETAPYVREVYRRVAGGLSVQKAALWVASLPTAARLGRAYTYERVRAILSKPLYIARPDKGNPDVLARPKGNWPALVDDETWRRVQEYIASHRMMPHQATGRYLLTGLLRCPRCGLRMTGRLHKGRQPRYRCTARISGAHAPNPACNWLAPLPLIDGLVMADIEPLITIVTSQETGMQAALEKAWERLRHPVDAEIAVRDRERRHWEGQAEQARRRMTRATEMYVDGDLARADYEAVRDKARAELDAAVAQLEQFGGPVKSAATLPSMDDAIRAAGGWKKLLAHGNVVAQREVLLHLIERVIPHRGPRRGQYTVHITWTALGNQFRQVAETVRASADAA